MHGSTTKLPLCAWFGESYPIVIWLIDASFEGEEDNPFEDEASFACFFVSLMKESLRDNLADEKAMFVLEGNIATSFDGFPMWRTSSWSFVLMKIRKYNFSWNIAADFNVEMTFHPDEIAQMLGNYENDMHTGMDIETVSEEIYRYTNG